jgi:hypothetical protein
MKRLMRGIIKKVKLMLAFLGAPFLLLFIIFATGLMIISIIVEEIKFSSKGV